MRVLPKTRWGTWTVAAAVWATGVTAAWFMSPVVPRAEWFDDDVGADLYEVRGAGPTVTTARFVHDRHAHHDPLFDRGSVDGPVRFWGAESGRTRSIYLPLLGFPDERFSHDGAWVLDHV